MKELSIGEIRSRELLLLKEFARICEKEKLNYSLAGGTLLGAVRHGGFIPWDDDIDVLMPRDDFENFINYCNNNSTSFELFSCKFNKNYEKTFAILSDKSTVIVDPFGHRGNYIKGIVIDIFPCDGAADTIEEVKRIYCLTRFRRELLNAANWKKFSRSRTRSLLIEPIRLFFYLISRFINPNKLAQELDGIYKKKSLKDCKYATCFSGTYREREIFRKEVYVEYCRLKFEDEEYCCLANYDEYLKTLYGNYMVLPDVEKQVSHHEYKAYWR